MPRTAPIRSCPALLTVICLGVSCLASDPPHSSQAVAEEEVVSESSTGSSLPVEADTPETIRISTFGSKRTFDVNTRSKRSGNAILIPSNARRPVERIEIVGEVDLVAPQLEPLYIETREFISFDHRPSRTILRRPHRRVLRGPVVTREYPASNDGFARAQMNFHKAATSPSIAKPLKRESRTIEQRPMRRNDGRQQRPHRRGSRRGR